MQMGSQQVVMQPLQWKTLKDIDEVRRIDDSDSECLEAIRKVLEKHDCLDRFGVTLLHSHFDVAEDEMMLEPRRPLQIPPSVARSNSPSRE
jgi:hypothetical protein